MIIRFPGALSIAICAFCEFFLFTFIANSGSFWIVRFLTNFARFLLIVNFFTIFGCELYRFKVMNWKILEKRTGLKLGSLQESVLLCKWLYQFLRAFFPALYEFLSGHRLHHRLYQRRFPKWSNHQTRWPF